jgi:outer membrane protein OmpA-like peptidoglycan-associated protein
MIGRRMNALRIRRAIVAAVAAPLLLALAGCSGARESVAAGPVPLPDELIVTRTDISLVPMTGLNSDADDFGLTMPLDTTLAFFTSNRRGAPGAHSIFTARSTGGAWTPARLAVELNNERSNGTPCIAPGGEMMYFAGCDYGLGDCDLYRVETGPRGGLADDVTPWTIPSNMGLPVNSGYWDSQVCMSSDGAALYFSSNRPGGLGGKDIWSCRRKRDGTWDEPVNLGERINTSFDEISPWLSPDGRTLFFSSNGHPGLGRFDVFAVEEIGGVRVLTNMGTPINSRFDEITFSMSAAGDRAFVASNREGAKGYDLFEITPVPVDVDPLVIVDGTVLDSKGRPTSATIIVTDLITTSTIGVFNTDPHTGTYAVVLPRGYDYSITAQALDHLFHSERVDVAFGLEKTAHRTVNFRLDPISGSVRLLVSFPENESSLERISMSDLDRAALFLRANANVRVEIAGHADAGEAGQSAAALSLARAQAVKAYLVGNRVPADRIDVKGYGASQPIGDDKTPEGRVMNRRVEMRVLIGTSP